MATAVSAKTAPQPGKARRPPPSAFAPNGVNGVRSSQSTPSPVISASRPGNAKQPPPPTSTPSTMINGTAARPTSRPKKDLQKPPDQLSRPQRTLTRISGPDGVNSDRRQLKRSPEPYVKTTPYILKKYAKYPPSFTIHLHPTHFGFDQQDGSFPYNSEMRVVIEHLKAGTIPHDMMEELLKGSVRFYEGCLIVRVVDHKSVATKSSFASKSGGADGKKVPFSVHNYNQHITPSPYMPYPTQNQSTSTTSSDTATAGQSREGELSPELTSDSAVQTAADSRQDPENLSTAKQNAPIPRVFTTVLHPTPLSLQAELTVLSMTPDPRTNNRRQSQTYAASRGAGSGSLLQTSSLTVHSASGSERGPAPKRQKMIVEPQDLLEFEAKLIKATAPPLYLEPVDSLEASQNLLKLLESPLNRKKPPSPKARKRTVAELAADEALAAEEERFMLIMDERLEPATSGASAVPKSATVDDETGAVPFEPRFSRFKTLENIRLQILEKAKLEHDRKVQQDQLKRQQQEAEREKRRLAEQRAAEEHAKHDARRQQLAAQHAHAQAQATQAAVAQNRRPGSQGSTGTIHAVPHTQPQQFSAALQARQSSPIVRNTTPHASSPLAAAAMVSQGSQGMPMSVASTSHGAGSPLQAISGLQHAHPAVISHAMAASRSQQSHSRHGTPQMAHGTPALSHTTPIMRNVTPIQHVSHSSPITSTMAQTPIMNHAMTHAPQSNSMMMTPQQIAVMHQRQQLLAQQGLAGHHQATPQQIAQMQATAQAQQNIQQVHQQQHRPQHVLAQQQQHPAAMQYPNQQAYQANLFRSQLAQLHMSQQAALTGQQQQQFGNPQQLTPQQMMALASAQRANGANNPQMQLNQLAQQRYSQMYQSHLSQLRASMAQKFQQQYGHPSNYPPHLRQQYEEGLERTAKLQVTEKMRRDQQAGQTRAAAQRAAQAQMQHQAQMNVNAHALQQHQQQHQNQQSQQQQHQ